MISKQNRLAIQNEDNETRRRIMYNGSNQAGGTLDIDFQYYIAALLVITSNGCSASAT